MANRAPIAHIGPPVIANLTVTVDGSLSEDPDGQIKRWVWSWGDDETSSGRGHPGVEQHTYSEAGDYDIVLTVRDQQRVPATATVSVTIVGTGPEPGPIDCVLSPWSNWTPVAGAAGQWTACSNGQQSRQEERSRHTITPPANGGVECDPNQHETRTATQACVIPPEPGEDDWVFGSKERQQCAFTGTKEVRYGASGHYVYEVHTDGVWCGNETFPDPIQGTEKECWIRDAQTGPPIPPQPGTRAVVSPADLHFIGFYRFHRDVGLMWWAGGNITSRKKDGKLRFFTRGDHMDNNPLWEMELPLEPPNPNLDTAPYMPLLRNWGGTPHDMIQTGGSGYTFGGTAWDESVNAVRWAYGDSYTPVQHHPNQIATVLNDADGSVKHYGPWRTEWTAQRTLGAFTVIPEWFRQYVAGQSLGVMAHMTSGAAGSPWGAALSALGFPALTAPPDTLADVNSKKVQNEGILLHTLSNRQRRDTLYRYESFNVQYDCSKGVTMTRGTNEWGGPEPAAGTGDSMQCVVWVDLPDKHGLVYFGQLVTTPKGYTAPNDAEGLVHMGYAALPKDAQGRHVCCHGQDDEFFQATGPWAHLRVPHGWIYDPNDLIASATGQAALHSRTPVHTFQLKETIAPFLPLRIKSGDISIGAVFDADSRRIYVPYRNDKVTHGPHARPSLMVFEVK